MIYYVYVNVLSKPRVFIIYQCVNIVCQFGAAWSRQGVYFDLWVWILWMFRLSDVTPTCRVTESFYNNGLFNMVTYMGFCIYTLIYLWVWPYLRLCNCSLFYSYFCKNYRNYFVPYSAELIISNLIYVLLVEYYIGQIPIVPNDKPYVYVLYNMQTLPCMGIPGICIFLVGCMSTLCFLIPS